MPNNPEVRARITEICVRAGNSARQFLAKIDEDPELFAQLLGHDAVIDLEKIRVIADWVDNPPKLPPPREGDRR